MATEGTMRAAGWRVPCERCSSRGWLRPAGFVDGVTWPIACTACGGRGVLSVFLLAKAIAPSRSEVDALRAAIRRLVLGQGVTSETALRVLDRLAACGFVG